MAGPAPWPVRFCSRRTASGPLEAIYPVVFVDALVAKVKDGGAVRNKAVNIAVGIGCEGVKPA